MLSPKKRYADLEQLKPAIAWFWRAIDTDTTIYGTAANDNDRPASVPDRNPTPLPAEALLKANERGALRFATEAKRVLQFVRIDGKLEPRTFVIPAGAITHIFGEWVGQESARERPPEGKKAVSERTASRNWFCEWLGARAARTLRKSMRRRKVAPPIDWTAFAHVRGDVPLDDARAACGLPAVGKCPPGLPYAPEPRRLFCGFGTGKGSRIDGAGNPSLVRRPDPDAYTTDVAIVERATLDRFHRQFPDDYETLAAAMSARSMSDLVAGNDNKTGKRKLIRAATTLQKFLAA